MIQVVHVICMLTDSVYRIIPGGALPEIWGRGVPLSL